MRVLRDGRKYIPYQTALAMADFLHGNYLKIEIFTGFQDDSLF